MHTHSILSRYGFFWVTLAVFLITLSGHWIFGWFAYVREQTDHGQAVEVTGYTIQMMRDTLENWQSEFLQLIWQVAGLAFLLHVVGSPNQKKATTGWRLRSTRYCWQSNQKRAIGSSKKSTGNTKVAIPMRASSENWKKAIAARLRIVERRRPKTCWLLYQYHHAAKRCPRRRPNGTPVAISVARVLRTVHPCHFIIYTGTCSCSS